MAMIRAIPEVNPVMTGEGMNEIRRPSRKSPTKKISTPAITPATHTPGSPCRVATTISTADMAPAGPEIW
jgi:hypothetical protein